MKSLLRALNPLNWSLWIKFTFGFVTAILIPLMLIGATGLLVLNGIYFQDVGKFLDQIVQNQQQVISNNLVAAQTSLESLTTQRELNEHFQPLLTEDVIAREDIENLSSHLQSIILTSPYFEDMRLLRNDGLLVARATAFSTISSTRTDSGSLAFQQASSGLLQNRYRLTIVHDSARVLRVELTLAIRDENGQTLGFMVAALNTANVFLSNLALPANDYGARLYLVPVSQTIWVSQDRVSTFSDATPLNRPVISAAVEGTAVNQTVASDAGSILSYGVPIFDPVNSNRILFALLIETSPISAVNFTLDQLGTTRLFVIVIGLGLVMLALTVAFHQVITVPLKGLRQSIQAITRGDFKQPVPTAARLDEIGEIGAAFVDMRQYVRNLLDDLESRIALRARDINATQEVSRFAATQRDLQTLMEQVVELIVEKFPSIYHSQIFLVDNARQFTVLRASTGEVGRLLLERGHRLAVGSSSLVGQASAVSRPFIARDTAASNIHRPNVLLPETLAELAVPLRVGNQVIGVLDVQSKFRNAFNPDEIGILETLADQVAVAIENARLYQESLRRLEELERANRKATLQAWQEYLYAQRERQMTSMSGMQTSTDTSELRQRAIQTGEIAVGMLTPQQTVPIAVPIRLRDQIIGAVEWEVRDQDMSDDKLQLAQELASRLAVSLDNARLFQESQRAAERERVVNMIAAKLTPQTQINDILQTAVREVGQALRSPQVSIRLQRPLNGNHNGQG